MIIIIIIITVQVIPIVVGSLGSVTKSLDKWLEKLDIRISISLLQKNILLGTGRIRVIEQEDEVLGAFGRGL